MTDETGGGGERIAGTITIHPGRQWSLPRQYRGEPLVARTPRRTYVRRPARREGWVLSSYRRDHDRLGRDLISLELLGENEELFRVEGVATRQIRD